MISSVRAATQPLPTSVCGHRFTNLTLLKAALTHPSSTTHSQADARLLHQRLEFLGDAVWSLYVSDALVALLPTASEGELTLRRARLVSAAALAEIAKIHRIPSLIILNKGEEASGGRHRASILSSVFEAVIGAVYLDGGAEEIRGLACSVCDDQLPGVMLGCDPKTALQQLTQSRFHETPRYYLLYRSGPPHAPTFEVEVRVGQSAIGRGSGRSKQDAEQEAARLAMAAFGHPHTHNI